MELKHAPQKPQRASGTPRRISQVTLMELKHAPQNSKEQVGRQEEFLKEP
jgi:hypothetical protein